MCSRAASFSDIVLESSRPTGDIYGSLYKTYQSKKLGKSVNDELKQRISTAILPECLQKMSKCTEFGQLKAVVYYTTLRMMNEVNSHDSTNF
jgi:hypothetical protein